MATSTQATVPASGSPYSPFTLRPVTKSVPITEAAKIAIQVGTDKIPSLIYEVILPKPSMTDILSATLPSSFPAASIANLIKVALSLLFPTSSPHFAMSTTLEVSMRSFAIPYLATDSSKFHYTPCFVEKAVPLMVLMIKENVAWATLRHEDSTFSNITLHRETPKSSDSFSAKTPTNHHMAVIVPFSTIFEAPTFVAGKKRTAALISGGSSASGAPAKRSNGAAATDSHTPLPLSPKGGSDSPLAAGVSKDEAAESILDDEAPAIGGAGVAAASTRIEEGSSYQVDTRNITVVNLCPVPCSDLSDLERVKVDIQNYLSRFQLFLVPEDLTL